MKFAHTNIISTNWKELADFYVKTFDCKIVPPIRKQSGEWLEKGTGLKNAKLEGAHLLLPGYGNNGPTLEIYQYENIERQGFVSPNKRGFGHIAFEVKSVEKVLETLEINGGKSLWRNYEKSSKKCW
jgi:catechol 2,3-dioxygenase-like lactoylglutathione lyase family enzyme